MFVVYPHSSVTHAFAPAQVATATIVGRPRMNIDFPSPMQTWVGRATMVGWALDLDTITGTGVSNVQIWARRAGEANRFLGNATTSLFRPDVQQAFGTQYPANTGWFAIAGGLPPGMWTLTATALGMANEAMLSQSVDVILLDGLRLQIDLPSTNATLGTGTNLLAGWALDVGAANGTGVSAVHVWAVPTNGSPATFLGVATLGLSRPDVAAAFGSQFGNAGYVRAFNLPAGTYTLPVLPIGSYTLTAQMAGFKTYVRNRVPVQVAQTTRVDVVLEVGGVEERVTVTAEAPLMNTDTSDVGLVVNSEKFLDLPLTLGGDIRNASAFIFLSPGVSGSTWEKHIGGGGSFSDAVYYDGAALSVTPNNDGQYNPSVDAIA
jgi:hypothetical protein